MADALPVVRCVTEPGVLGYITDQMARWEEVTFAFLMLIVGLYFEDKIDGWRTKRGKKRHG